MLSHLISQESMLKNKREKDLLKPDETLSVVTISSSVVQEENSIGLGTVENLVSMCLCPKEYSTRQALSFFSYFNKVSQLFHHFHG